MAHLNAERPMRHGDGLSRRDVLHAGAWSLLGLSLPGLLAREARGAERPGNEVNCILLVLTGGPSQLDTWDLKPDTPSEIRGPYRPIKTNVSGIEISEIFPHMARHADKYALVRSVHHTTAVHDIGHQAMQTGRVFEAGVEHPHAGCVVSKLQGKRNLLPAHVVLPAPLGPTGGNLPQGQNAGYLGRDFDPLVLQADFRGPDAGERNLLPPNCVASMREEEREALSQALNLRTEPEAVRRKYGDHRFGQSCLVARRLVERGVRFVTVNMFETVFNEITWDCHGMRPFPALRAYQDQVGPWFDYAYSALLEDLAQRGMLENTLVVCTGEFGRTPRINPAGGRDHWPHVWTMLFAGGRVRGGQVIGASDEIGAYPKERPVTPAEVTATLYHALGIDPQHELRRPDGEMLPLVERGVKPITELF